MGICIYSTNNNRPYNNKCNTFFDTIFLSFNKTGAFGKMTWAGVENYLKFFNDPTVWQATKNTIVYMLLSVPLGILLALIFAALLNSKIKGKSIYRAIYFLPIVVAPAAVAWFGNGYLIQIMV